MSWRVLFWLPVIPMFACACVFPFWQERRAGALVANLGGLWVARLLCLCLGTGLALFEGTKLVANWDSGHVPGFARVLAVLVQPIVYLYLASIGRQVREHGLRISGRLVRWRRVERWEWLGFSGDPTLMLVLAGERGKTLTWRIPAAKRPIVEQLLSDQAAQQATRAGA
jgi:hypothetical protein